MFWIYKNKEVLSHKDLLPDCTDFVYVIIYEDSTFYIGKKTVRSKRKYPPLKGKKRPRRLWKDLPFINYEGSAKDINKSIKKKEILYQCSTKKAATYIEAALLFEHILDDKCMNLNVLGKFFPDDLNGVLDG